jgi:hypothetical protein
MTAGRDKRSTICQIPRFLSPRMTACGFLLVAYCSLLSCSLPNLEPVECTEARTQVREFYSFHFGNDMRFSEENLKLREQFLTREFADRLRQRESEADPFTLTSDHPKAFRVGECTILEPGKRVRFDVLNFWKTDTQSIQRSITVETVNEDGKWSIDTVAVAKSEN